MEIPTWLRDVAALLGVLAFIATAVATIWGKALGPWVARPLARAVRKELQEAVEAIILSDLIQGHIKEATEEAVAAEMSTVTTLLADHEVRLERIERQTTRIERQTRPARRG